MFKRWLALVAIGWAWSLAITPLPWIWPDVAVEVLVWALVVATIVFVFTRNAPLLSAGVFVEILLLSALASASAQIEHPAHPLVQFMALLLSAAALFGHIVFRIGDKRT